MLRKKKKKRLVTAKTLSRDFAQAKAFSEEVGGAVEVLRRFFLQLSQKEMHSVLNEYAQLYGADAREYVVQSLPYWRRGIRPLAGDVADRLFDLLPRRMPQSVKYAMAEKLWEHYGPAKSITMTIGPNSSPADVSMAATQALDDLIGDYPFPERMKERFHWLAAGDVLVVEELLNRYRRHLKLLALEKLTREVPLLQEHVAKCPKDAAKAKTVLRIHKQELCIWLRPGQGEAISMGPPKTPLTLRESILLFCRDALKKLIKLLF